MKPPALRQRHERISLVLGEAVLRACESGEATVTPFFGIWDRSGPRPVARARSLQPGDGLVRLGCIGTPETAPENELLLTPGKELAASLGGLPVEVLSASAARYRDRILALPGVDALKGRTVVLVGLGSVGSDLGTRLARVGARVIGCDPDVLSTENLIRWGLQATIEEDVGHPKSWVWERTLRHTIPGVQIQGHEMDIVNEVQAFDALLRRERPALLVVATDTRDSRRVANAMAALHRIPALFVALSDGAASIRIEVVEDAQQGPCHLCSQLAEGSLEPSAGRGSRTPYAADLAPQPRAVPALPVDVAVGTALATRVALQMLSSLPWQEFLDHGEQRGNVLFMGLRPGFWVFESAWERLTYQAERYPGCPCCGAAHSQEI